MSRVVELNNRFLKPSRCPGPIFRNDGFDLNFEFSFVETLLINVKMFDAPTKRTGCRIIIFYSDARRPGILIRRKYSITARQCDFRIVDGKRFRFQTSLI